MYTDPNRNTGRTTRMLATALAQAKDGETSFVVGIHEDWCDKFLIPKAQWVAGQVFPGVEFSRLHGLRVQFGLGAVQFLGSRDNTIDWPSQTIRGIRTMVYVDHCVVEQRYNSILELFHMFDAPPPPKVDTRKDELVAEVNRLRALLATALFDLNKTSGQVNNVIALISREEL